MRRRRRQVNSEAGRSTSSAAAASVVPSGQSSALLHRTDYAQERKQAEQVEATIVELSGMFQRISQSVAEQSELLTRIDVTLEESESAISRAQQQLLQFWDSLQGERGLAIKLLLALVLVAFLMFYFFR